MSLPRWGTFALTFTCGQLLITFMDIALGSEVTFLWKISMHAALLNRTSCRTSGTSAQEPSSYKFWCLMFLLQVTGAFGSSLEVMISVCGEMLISMKGST